MKSTCIRFLKLGGGLLSSNTNLMPEYNFGWQEWIAENLMRGIDIASITSVMLSKGFEFRFATDKIKEAQASPAIAAGRRLFRANAKLNSMINVLGDLYFHSEMSHTIPRIDNPTYEEFFSFYYYANRPVILKGLMVEWQALSTWTPDYFEKQFDNCDVQISADRDSDDRYEENFAKHCKTVKMKEFIKSIREGGETNTCYLVGKNGLLDMPEFDILKTHFQFPKQLIDTANPLRTSAKIWIGPKGTVTPLHHDLSNILFGQIYGRKHVKLISPLYIPKLYNNRAFYSAVDLTNIDYDKYPLMNDVVVMDVVVEPGEFLLIPVGWWHWVKSLDISISLSLQGFYTKGKPIVWKC